MPDRRFDAPPLGFAQGVPQQNVDQRDVQYIMNLISDNISAVVITGTTIRGGALYTDSLGSFYPVVISPTGGMTINSSPNAQNSLIFHDSSGVISDMILSVSAFGGMSVGPKSSSVSYKTFYAVNSSGNNPGGIGFYSGTNVHNDMPRMQVSDPGGVSGVAAADIIVYLFDANYLNFTGVGTGFAPQVKSLGVDTDIDIILRPKGAGLVRFFYASNALGGGAAATLGTIGGTGPVTAAQNSWYALKDSAGATIWFPAWK